MTKIIHNLEKIINILIATDLIAIFIINLTGGIDLGISILKLKLKATEFYRPVNLLLILVILKIILIWKRASIWERIKNRLSFIANLCTNPKTYKYLTLITLGAIVIFGAKLRISHYTSKAMWWDEVLVLITVKNRSFIDVIKQLSYSLHEPLYYLFVKAMYFFSRSDAVIKLPSLVSGIATIIALFYVARNLCGRRIALASAYLLSVCVVHIKYSQMLRMYTMVTLFSLMSTYMLFQFLDSRGNTKKMWGYIIFTALSLNTHILSITVFAVQIGYIIYCLIEEGTLKLLANKKIAALFILSISLIANALLINSFSIKLREIALQGTLSQKIPLLISCTSLFFITSISISILNTLLTRQRYSSSQQSFINLKILGKLILAGTLIIALCPSLVKSVFDIFSKTHIRNAQITFISENIEWVINYFKCNLVAKHWDWNLWVQRDKFFSSMFILGIIISFLKKKKWTILFALHAISAFVLILIIGYNQNSGVLGDRHLLFTLPPIILLVSSGLVWGLDSVFNIKVGGKIFLLLRNILTISLILYIFTSDWDANSANINDWYREEWPDWHSYGGFINENLHQDTLFFFPDQCFQHHASAYVNKETEYLIFHPANSSLKKRTVWIANSFSSKEDAREKGFEKIFNTHGDLYIYMKEFLVNPPIVISDSNTKDWTYYSNFNGYESRDSSGYKFITDSYKIKNISNRQRHLQPSISNEPCSIIYKFINSSNNAIKSFTLEINCSIGRASYIKIKSSPDGILFKELKKIEEGSGAFSFDISEDVKGLDSFYIEFELFSKRLPEDFVDSLGKVSINYIQFQATFF